MVTRVVFFFVFFMSCQACADPKPLEIIAGSDQLFLGADELEAQPSMDHSNRPAVSIFLSKSAGDRFAELTKGHLGNNITIRVCGVVVMTPMLLEPILHGKIQMTGSFTVEETKEMAAQLETGDCGTS